MKTVYFVLVFFLLSTFLNSTIINVPADQSSIQAGINAAANTDTVLVQPDTYVENINFNGKLITVGSLFLTTADTSYISTTIIDGNEAGSVVTFNSDEDSTAVLTGFTITNGSDSNGGGISCYSSCPILERLTISGNTATSYGGGIYSESSSSNLQNVTIAGNSANYGGGIFSNGSSPSLQYVIISGNSVSNGGGGIFCRLNSNPNLKNVTITDNSASTGSGVYCEASTFDIINSILWNDSLNEIHIESGSVAATYSDIQGGLVGTGNINSDPLFVDSGNGDYHLQSTSPCIDAGDPASPLDPDGTIVDMGTYYFNQPIKADFTVDVTSGYLPLTVNFTDLSTSATSVIDEWYWDFGDGNNSSLQNPSNEYLTVGLYTVSLTVTDENDSTNSETKVDYIAVQSFAYSGSIWHISTTGSDITGNGSEQFPFATIQHGISASSNTDTVFVQPGTYVENINYNGKLITVGSLFLTTQDTSYISTTIIDGDSINSVVRFGSGEDSTAVLSGFTITNGYAYCGGGIYCCSYSSPTLQNLIITANNTHDYRYGGGIACYFHSDPKIQNVTISDNYADFKGGGFYCYFSNPYLQNVTIIGNTAVYYGGGFYCVSSSPSLSYVTITDNSGYDGGGAYLYNSSGANFDNVTIADNSVTHSGGGIYCYNSSGANFDNLTIAGNLANSYGGGIICYFSSPNFDNLTIAGNSAYHGGGIYCLSSNPVLTNSILWNDSPQEIYINSGSVTATYSDILGGWAGTGNIDADPLFTDPGNGDYHLSWANFPVPDATMSPCIDTGDPYSPFDPDGTIADMGAFYFDRSPAAPVITAVEDVPNDQGRYAQVRWNRSPYDAPNSPVTIKSYSVWRYDDIFGDLGKFETYEDPREIFEKAAKDNDKNYYWQRDDEILTFIAQLPAVGYAQYSVVAPTLIDSSVVSINYSAFKVLAHTDVTLIYYPSLPDSGYSVDNIAPDETETIITKNGSNMNLSWDEVEYGTYQGNSYPEINGIWYKIYAGNFPDFVCDEIHLIDTITNLNYDYSLTGEEKKFFKIVVSDQPDAGRSIKQLNNYNVPKGDYRNIRK